MELQMDRINTKMPLWDTVTATGKAENSWYLG